MAKGPNPAMRSKRVTGPSAQAIMLTHIRLERCKIAGCKAPVLVTKNVTGVKKVRLCAEHIGSKPTKVKPTKVSDLLKFGWQ